MFNKLPEEAGELITRMFVMPEHLNINNIAFGGMIISYMDLAASMTAIKVVKTKSIATVAMNKIHFIKPINMGDEMCICAKSIKVGNTSVTTWITVYISRNATEAYELAVEGEFINVKLNEHGHPEKISK